MAELSGLHPFFDIDPTGPFFSLYPASSSRDRTACISIMFEQDELWQESRYFSEDKMDGPFACRLLDLHNYVNLKLPGEREAANADPLGYIRSRPSLLIIDEAQLSPELFNVIQVESDRAGVPGQYVLSGSQNFILNVRFRNRLRAGLEC